MGRKGSWFSAVKKALSPNESKEKNDKRKLRTRSTSINSVITNSSEPIPSSVSVMAADPTSPTIEDIIKLTQAQNEQNKHVYSVALATAAAAEAAVSAAQAAAEIVRLTTATGFPNMKSTNEESMAAADHVDHVDPTNEQEMAAVMIQKSYRGYRVRKESMALKGFSRLKTLVESKSVKRQAMTTLKCMQTLAHVQSQVQVRRIQMTEENLALQKESPDQKLIGKPNEWIMGSPESSYSKDLEMVELPKMHSKDDEDNNLMGGSNKSFKKQMSEPKMQNKLQDKSRVIKIKENELIDQDWIGSPQSKEQMEAMMINKQEAAIKRERALAYSYSHQQTWRNQSAKKETQTILDSQTPEWGWNWLDKWVTCETVGEKEDDNSSVHSSSRHANSNSNSPSRRLSSSTPHSKPPNMAKITRDEGRSPTHHRAHTISSPKISRARHAAPSPLGNATSENSRRTNKSLSFSTPSHTRNSSFSSTKSMPTKKGYYCSIRANAWGDSTIYMN